MNNIYFNKQIVNTSSERITQSDVDLAIKWKLSPTVWPSRWLKTSFNTYIPKFDLYGIPKKGCCFNMPSFWAPHEDTRKKKNPLDRDKRFPMRSEIDKVHTVPDNLLKAIRDIQLGTAPIISLKNYDNSTFTFKGTVKGSNAYNYKQFLKSVKDAKTFAAGHPHVYFLTLTYDAKLYDGSRLVANDLFKKEKQKVIKSLKRKYGVQVQCVIEQTNRGYPHAHLIIYSQEALIHRRISSKKTRKIVQGKFYNFVAKHCTLGRFDLRQAENKNLAGYLAKYMSKANFDENPEGKTESEKLTKAQRKAFLTNYFPCVYGYRGYSSTFRKKKVVSLNDTEETIAESATVSQEDTYNAADVVDEVEFLSKAVAKTAALISFRIKENHRCLGMVRLLKKVDKTPLEKRHLGREKGLTPALVKEGLAIDFPMHCEQCQFIKSLLEISPKLEENIMENLPKPWLTEEEFMEYCKIEEKARKDSISYKEIRKNREEYGILDDFQVVWLAKNFVSAIDDCNKYALYDLEVMSYRIQLHNIKKFNLSKYMVRFDPSLFLQKIGLTYDGVVPPAYRSALTEGYTEAKLKHFSEHKAGLREDVRY